MSSAGRPAGRQQFDKKASDRERRIHGGALLFLVRCRSTPPPLFGYFDDA
jgi:hypothetical protein